MNHDSFNIYHSDAFRGIRMLVRILLFIDHRSRDKEEKKEWKKQEKMNFMKL